MASLKQFTNTKGETCYKLIAYLGYDEKGKQIRRFKNWKPPKTQTGKGMTEKAASELAEKTAYEWEKSLLGGEITTKPITLSELFKLWDKLHITLKPLAPKTTQSYRYNWNRLEPYLGYIKTDNINTRLINEVYANFQKDGENLKTGGKKAVGHFHGICLRCFRGR